MINYDYIIEYIRATIKPSTGLLAELEEYAAVKHVPIIQPEVAAFMKVIGQLKQPFRILEVGTAIGYSSILFSEFLKQGGIIDTIERNEEMIELARNNIKAAGRQNTINVIAGDASDVLACLDKSYDMIFMDAAKGQYGEFFEQCKRMLAPGGLLVSDNVLYKGMIASEDLVARRKRTIVARMREFLQMLCEDEAFETSIIPIGDGVALSFRKPCG
ncbi:putative O-methyltransferase YrrM [Ruminiclostridium sufflavum DSM 19573]|uniref:tRNA 5-hydroxyuridine methyltransferase n=1 Tax=Ruminiclostridium sufflavum DSM 19573 TaxID=1121337 RepID=A0A318XKB3_9FIRM|nr:O-methyltransferase [Ruminiclostridium sufflavum]PYG86976.1 putative O-methyltransferase YrrM [Ruminiclostridium sufflavum DSM 19573]